MDTCDKSASFEVVSFSFSIQFDLYRSVRRAVNNSCCEIILLVRELTFNVSLAS